MGVIRIADLHDQRLEDYRRVSDAELLRLRNVFVAEGRLVVERLIEDSQAVISVLLNSASQLALAEVLARLDPGVPVYVCDARDFTAITGFNLHRGCLAIVERPSLRSVRDVIHECELLLVLEGVTDADNVGSAFRNAAAFGAHVLLSPTCCDPLYRKAIRTSMGSVLRVPYARFIGWPELMSELKTEGFTVVALTPEPNARNLSDLERHARTALLVGTEGPGLTNEARQAADVRARIPISAAVDSLNLATAAGIALFQLRRP